MLDLAVELPGASVASITLMLLRIQGADSIRSDSWRRRLCNGVADSNVENMRVAKLMRVNMLILEDSWICLFVIFSLTRVYEAEQSTVPLCWGKGLLWCSAMRFEGKS